MDERIRQRQAIEGLRSGIPNRDAVQLLGSSQPEIEASYHQLLADAKERAAAGQAGGSLLMAGDFGSGKSHLMEHFHHQALDQGFVCSKLVVSKEMPLYDPVKVYRAAISGAAVPGVMGAPLPELAARLDPSRPEYVAFREWVNGESGLNPRFAATLHLHEQMRGDHDIQERILGFWGGDRINTGELKKALKSVGAASAFSIEKAPTGKDLAIQRFSFISRLIVAAGYSGWLLLLDEVELVGRYSFMQRARSYAEIARLSNKLQGETIPCLASVFAITRDFEEAVLEGRNDRERIPGKLRASNLPADLALASRSERGMRLISRERLSLRPPDQALLLRTYLKTKATHAAAYGWSPPEAGSPERLGSTPIRTYVRFWINEWDLRRAYPDYSPETVVAELHPSYQEDPDLEAPPETDISEDGGRDGSPGWVR
ncbi:MAG: BREX system ATP-binding domain-containing protein [Chloroflexota bacterium]